VILNNALNVGDKIVFDVYYGWRYLETRDGCVEAKSGDKVKISSKWWINPKSELPGTYYISVLEKLVSP
jgi:hypothetical protein